MKRMLSGLLPVIIVSLLIFQGCNKLEGLQPYDDLLPPGIPDNLFVSYAADGEINIRWSANVEPDFYQYIVYRGVNDSLNLTELFRTFRTSFFDDSLSYDSAYYYAVAAIDNSGKISNKTRFVSARPLNYYTPLSPRRLSVSATFTEGRKAFTISWDTNNESDVRQYRIYRSHTVNFTPDTTQYYIARALSFTDTINLSFYDTLYYRVQAVDEGGLKSAYTEAVYDLLLESPAVIYPPDNSVVSYFDYFEISSLPVNAGYRIVLYEDPYGSEYWETSGTRAPGEKQAFLFRPPFLQVNKDYYWRIFTYSGKSTPNSVSKLYKFRLRESF